MACDSGRQRAWPARWRDYRQKRYAGQAALAHSRAIQFSIFPSLPGSSTPSPLAGGKVGMGGEKHGLGTPPAWGGLFFCFLFFPLAWGVPPPPPRGGGLGGVGGREARPGHSTGLHPHPRPPPRTGGGKRPTGAGPKTEWPWISPTWQAITRQMRYNLPPCQPVLRPQYSDHCI
jgi:hypothetical protein